MGATKAREALAKLFKLLLRSDSVKPLVRCPYCGFEGEFKVERSWRFRFYEVRRLSCPRCGGVFNHYRGTSPRGRLSEFVIRVKPRVIRAAASS